MAVNAAHTLLIQPLGRLLVAMKPPCFRFLMFSLCCALAFGYTGSGQRA